MTTDSKKLFFPPAEKNSGYKGIKEKFDIDLKKKFLYGQTKTIFRNLTKYSLF
jgi:hypothetical protein